MNGAIEGNDRLAVLIDADNADPGVIDGILDEISQFGVASVKRIYGDWARPQLGRWRDPVLRHSIQPIQQFAYTTGKNATDIAMVIDAMDLLHTGPVAGFCLVSSDSDFTRLAARIRESGKRVYGFGESKTPQSFVTACDKFISTEIFKTPTDPGTPPASRLTPEQLREDSALVRLMTSAVQTASGETGRADLAVVGSLLSKQRPDFDSRRYGYAKLSDLAVAIGLFTVIRPSNGRVLLSLAAPASAPKAPVKKTAAKKTAKKVAAKKTAAGESPGRAT